MGKGTQVGRWRLLKIRLTEWLGIVDLLRIGNEGFAWDGFLSGNSVAG